MTTRIFTDSQVFNYRAQYAQIKRGGRMKFIQDVSDRHNTCFANVYKMLRGEYYRHPTKTKKKTSLAMYKGNAYHPIYIHDLGYITPVDDVLGIGRETAVKETS